MRAGAVQTVIHQLQRSAVRSSTTRPLARCSSYLVFKEALRAWGGSPHELKKDRTANALGQQGIDEPLLSVVHHALKEEVIPVIQPLPD